jgi:hypothetical protein
MKNDEYDMPKGVSHHLWNGESQFQLLKDQFSCIISLIYKHKNKLHPYLFTSPWTFKPIAFTCLVGR